MLPDPTSYIVKIELYKGCHVQEVVYYRYEVPAMLFARYKWYFEYLAALVKVAHPKEKVNLITLQIGTKDPFLAGKYYIEKKFKTLLSAKKGQLNKLQKMPFQDDLFSFKSEEVTQKIERLQKEIDALENGAVIFWVPPTYINKIKRFSKTNTKS